jgi:hypothetical protein
VIPHFLVVSALMDLPGIQGILEGSFFIQATDTTIRLNDNILFVP